MTCFIEGCGSRVHARRLCKSHYNSWSVGRLTVPEADAFGALRVEQQIPPLCVCDVPAPDGIGECRLCRRVYRADGFLDATRAAWRAFLGRSTVAVGVCVVVLLASILGLSGAAAASPTAPSSAPGVPPRAILLGDSISYQAEPYWRQVFQPHTDTTYVAKPGWAMKDYLKDHAGWVAAMTSQPAGTPVILALGGNDAIQRNQVPYDPIPYWRHALDALADRCVVVPDMERGLQISVSGSVVTTLAMGAQRQSFYSRLRPLLDSYPNVHVVPWEDLTRTHPEYYAADRLHHTDAGNKAYAWSMWLGLVKACGHAD